MRYFLSVQLWLDSNQVFRHFLQKKSDMLALIQEI